MPLVKTSLLHITNIFLILNIYSPQVKSQIFIANTYKANSTESSELFNMNNLTGITHTEEKYFPYLSVFESYLKDISTSIRQPDIKTYDKTDDMKMRSKYSESNSKEVTSENRSMSARHHEVKSYINTEKGNLVHPERRVEHNKVKKDRREVILGKNESPKKSIKSSEDVLISSHSDDHPSQSHKRVRRSFRNQRQKLKTSDYKYSGKTGQKFPTLKKQNKLKNKPNYARNRLKNKRPPIMKGKLNKNPKTKKINKKKPSYSAKKKYYNRYGNKKGYSAKKAKPQALKKIPSKSIRIKKRNPLQNEKHDKMKWTGGKYFRINDNDTFLNNTMQKEAEKHNASKTENIKVRKIVAHTQDSHVKSRPIVKNEHLKKNKSVLPPRKNKYHIKRNETEILHKSKKAIEFHISNGKSKILDGRNKSDNKNHSKDEESKRERNTLEDPKFNKGDSKEFENKKKVGLQTNNHTKIPKVSEPSLKIRRRRLLKGNRSLRNDETNLLYKVKDFIVSNFAKQKKRREANSSHVKNETKNKDNAKQILEEMKDFVVKNFESERMNTFPNLSRFGSDDFSFFHEEPKNDLRKMKFKTVSKRDEKSSPDLDTESVTVDEYDDTTTEKNIKEEETPPTINNTDEINTSLMPTTEYNDMSMQEYDKDTTIDRKIDDEKEFTTGDSFTTFPSTMSSEKTEIFSRGFTKRTAGDTVNENFGETTSFSDQNSVFESDSIADFTLTPSSFSYTAGPNKKNRNIFQSEPFSSDFSSDSQASESSTEIPHYDNDIASTNISVDESSLASTDDVVSNPEGTSSVSTEMPSTTQNYSNSFFQKSISISTGSSTEASNSVTHPKSVTASKSQNRRAVFKHTNEVLKQDDYEEPVSTLADDFKEQDDASFYTMENNEEEVMETTKEENKEKQTKFDKHIKNENKLKSHDIFSSQNKESISKPGLGEKVPFGKNQSVKDDDYEDTIESSNNELKNNQEYDDEFSSFSDFSGITTSTINNKLRISKNLEKINYQSSGQLEFSTQPDININNPVTTNNHESVVIKEKQTNHRQIDDRNDFDKDLQKEKDEEYSSEDTTELNDMTGTTSEETLKSTNLIKQTSVIDIVEEENVNENTARSVKNSFKKHAVKNIKPVQNVLDNKNDVELATANPITPYINAGTKPESDSYEGENNYHSEAESDKHNEDLNNNAVKTRSREQESEYDYEYTTEPSATDNHSKMTNGDSNADKHIFVKSGYQRRNEIKSESPVSLKGNGKNRMESVKHLMGKDRDEIITSSDNTDILESYDEQSEIKLSSSSTTEENFENGNVENRPTEFFPEMNPGKKYLSKQTQVKRKMDKKSTINYDDESNSESNDLENDKKGDQLDYSGKELGDDYENESNVKHLDSSVTAISGRKVNPVREKNKIPLNDIVKAKRFQVRKSKKFHSPINVKQKTFMFTKNPPNYEVTTTKNVNGTDAEEISDNISVSNEYEEESSLTSKSTEISLDLQSVKSSKTQESQYSDSPKTYSVTLRNVKIMPYVATENLEDRNLYPSSETKESATLSEDRDLNRDNEEYYDEIADNHSNQKSSRGLKNNSKNAKIIAPKTKVLSKDRQKIRDKQNRKKTSGRMNHHHDIASNLDFEEGKGTTVGKETADVEDAKDVMDKMQPKNDPQTKRNNKLKEYLDSIAHSKHKKERYIESITHIKTRKTRDVLSAEATVLADAEHESHLTKFITPGKQWLIGIIGLLTISSMTIGIYYVLPKRSKTKRKSFNNLSNVNFTRIDVFDEDDSEIYPAVVEINETLPEDVKYVTNFITDVLNRCDDSEDGNLKEEYSTSYHISKIRLARSGIVE